MRTLDGVTKAIMHSLSSTLKKESCAKDASIQIVLSTGACADNDLGVERSIVLQHFACTLPFAAI